MNCKLGYFPFHSFCLVDLLIFHVQMLLISICVIRLVKTYCANNLPLITLFKSNYIYLPNSLFKWLRVLFNQVVTTERVNLKIMRIKSNEMNCSITTMTYIHTLTTTSCLNCNTLFTFTSFLKMSFIGACLHICYW